MIDWYSVVFSALWIVGLGIVIAGLSLAYYLANKHNIRFRQAFEISAYKTKLGLGMVCFCAGQAGGAVLWGRLVWIALVLFFVLQTIHDRKTSNL
jgi:hypothetical protein